VFVCTVYVVCSTVTESLLSWRESASVRFTQAPVKLSSRSSTPSPTLLFTTSDPIVFKASASTPVTKTESAAAACTKSDVADVKSNAVTSSAVEVCAFFLPVNGFRTCRFSLQFLPFPSLISRCYLFHNLSVSGLLDFFGIPALFSFLSFEFRLKQLWFF